MLSKNAVTKMNAVECQLISATELYFNDASSISIHTLTAAAYNILRDISDKRGYGKMIVKDEFVGRSPKKKELLKWINSFENFFKHADKDPEGTIEINFEITELLLIDAWAQFEKIGGLLPPAGKAFKIWTGNVKMQTPPVIAGLHKEVKKMSKKQIFECFGRT